MKIVFMGTPAFAVPSLQALLTTHEVAAVLTQPDRPAGRGNKLTASPVKEAALAAGLTVYTPDKLLIKKGVDDDARTVRARLKALYADVFVVAAYGLLLPKAILDMPRLGCINVHASLLPRYRGASPIHAAILNGDETAGVTIMHMAEGLDTGDMILHHTMDIGADEHFPAVHDRMAALGATALLDALNALEYSTANRTPQEDALSTYAPMIKKTDGLIDWTQPTAAIVNKIRAFDPWPGAYTMLDGQALKIWRGYETEAAEGEAALPPGTVLTAGKEGLRIRTGDGVLLATELQGTNGKKMPAADFLRGRMVEVGRVLPA